MRTEISKKEFKNEKLEFNNLEFCFLLAIKNKHPEMWSQLKGFIETIERYK